MSPNRPFQFVWWYMTLQVNFQVARERFSSLAHKKSACHFLRLLLLLVCRRRNFSIPELNHFHTSFCFFFILHFFTYHALAKVKLGDRGCLGVQGERQTVLFLFPHEPQGHLP